MVNPVRVIDLGAVWDGQSHPLSQRYSSLAAAQAAYPFVTSLSQELDWAATYQGVRTAASLGTVLELPAGRGIMGNDGLGQITITRFKSFSIRGAGSDLTEIVCGATMPLWLDVVYPLNGWWITPDDPAQSAGSVRFEGFSLCTRAEGNQQSTAIRIDGGYLAGRTTRKTYIRDVDWRGVNRTEQGWFRGLDLYDAAFVFVETCRWICGNTIGDFIYSRSRGRPNGGGGYYLSHVEAFGGHSMMNIGVAVEGVYLTQCVTDGAIRYSVLWRSAGGLGLMVTGGQYAAQFRCFDLQNVGDFVFSGVDFRGAGQDWIGILANGATGGSIVGNHFIAVPGRPTAGVFIEASPNIPVRGVNIAGNTFASLDVGITIAATANRVQISDDNLYENIRVIPINNAAPQNNFVRRRRFNNEYTRNIPAGATNHLLFFDVPAGYFFQSPRQVFVNGIGNDMIGTYIPNQSTPTSLAVYVHLPNYAALPGSAFQFGLAASD